MGERTIYFLFTDTGTYLARAINYCTKESLNHVSIAFDPELKEVYSFGRKRPRNPFIGGFVREDIRSDFLRDSQCAIYAYRVSEDDYEKVLQKIKEIEEQKHNYKYNFLGLFGVMFQIEMKRENALFCSQFVATVLQETESFKVQKPPCFVTPSDIRNHGGLKLIYRGKLKDYRADNEPAGQQLLTVEKSRGKLSFIYLMSKKVKRIVIK